MELGLEMELTYVRGTADMVNALTRVARAGVTQKEWGGHITTWLDVPIDDFTLYEVMEWAFGWREHQGFTSNLHLEVREPGGIAG
jgi:hypothetical protein